MAAVNVIIGVSNLFCALLCGGLALPFLRDRVKPNAWYGVRFKRCYESEALWYAINRYGARRMLFWSAWVLAAGVAAFFVPLEGHSGRTLALALAPLVYLIACAETYRYARSR